jgi:AcrR family transcriptional regulator
MSLVPALKSLALPLLTPAVARPRKGDTTRASIVEAALAVASREGLEGLTIGGLAEALAMSKSGVFAHFGSREELQLAVLKAYARRFVDQVLVQAVRAPRGMPRLAAILDLWLAHLAQELSTGCILIGGAFEYDDREGPLRDAMVEIIDGWNGELLKAIRLSIDEGHLRRDVDAKQMAFEIYGLMLATHQAARLLRSGDAMRRARAGVTRLLTQAGTPAGTRALAKPLSAKPIAPRRTARTPRSRIR